MEQAAGANHVCCHEGAHTCSSGVPQACVSLYQESAQDLRKPQLYEISAQNNLKFYGGTCKEDTAFSKVTKAVAKPRATASRAAKFKPAETNLLLDNYGGGVASGVTSHEGDRDDELQ